MKEFDGYTVLITGGGSGIGRKTAEQFVERGADVIILDSNKDAINDTVSSIGNGICGKICDITDSNQILEVVQFVKERYGKFDVLVNSAATVRWGNIETLAEEDWDLTVNSVLKGPYLITKHFIPLLKNSVHPSVINISSLAALQNWPKCPAYGAAKAGLVKLSQQVTRDFYWLRCNTIQPGVIDTPMYRHSLTEEKGVAILEKYKSLTPAGRVGTAEDIGNCILFLASEKASFVNGATLLVDGGFTQNWLPDW